MNFESELTDLRDWLNSNTRDFDAGLQLYIAYFEDTEMRKFITAHRNAGMLYDAIRNRAIELRDAIAEQGKVTAAPKNVNRTINIHVDAGQAEAPAVNQMHEKPLNLSAKGKLIARLESEWKQLRAEQGIWHTQMSDIGLDDKGKPREHLTKSEMEKRHELALLLIEHEKEIKRIWANLEYVNVNGVLPGKEQPAPAAAANENDFKRLKNSINPNISKLKKKIAEIKPVMATQSGNAWDKSNQRLTDWEQQLSVLEAEKLKITNGEEQGVK